MPELPEVEVVRRGVAEHIVGRRILDCELPGARVARRHLAGPDDLRARVAGRFVAAARRRGKYLWLVLTSAQDDPLALIIHLGMSGQLLVLPAGAAPARHTHALFWLGAPEPRIDPLGGPVELDTVDRELHFVDQRTFGGISLTPLVPDPFLLAGASPWEPFDPACCVPEPVVTIAPDPLEPAFDRSGVVLRMKARRSAVKRALLDQHIISGIGNIYADEALWRARVHGERVCASLSRPALGRIVDHAAQVMMQALAHGGTSFDALYVNVNGASGYFDRSLAAYGQVGRPCPRCGALIRREAFMNRSSFSCPRCQPRPRPPR